MSGDDSGRIRPGMMASTSYGTGPYLIQKVVRGCVCGGSRAVVSGDHSPTDPHIHLVCLDLSGGTTRYLNGYCEHTLTNVWDKRSRLVIDGVEPESAPLEPCNPGQGVLF